jgi:NAD(P)-dependent dehydrogenase (short-subunit alcohol dehydrogenase family)
MLIASWSCKQWPALEILPDREQVNQFIEDIKNRFGRIDILVNNAVTHATELVSRIKL